MRDRFLEAAIFMILVAFVVAVCASAAHSEPAFKEQNYLASAHQGAIDYLKANGCKTTKITILNKYQSKLTPDGVKIEGPAYRVRCVAKSNVANLMWLAPKKREDGTDVVVTNYILHHNGTEIRLGAAQQIAITDLVEGANRFSIQAVDMRGVRSKMSNEVYF